MKKMGFNIHNLIKFTVSGTNESLVKKICQNYSYFLTQETIEPDFNIIISDLNPSLDDCYFINHKYYIKRNFIYYKDNYKIVRWKICIENIETKPTIYFNGGLFSDIFLNNNFIEPLIAWLLSQKGYSLIHASSVAIENWVYIFPACKGVGKTSTILNLSNYNAAYMSNEPTLISKEGVGYSFPTNIQFYYYNLKENPNLSDKISFKYKVELKLKYIIYLLSLKYGSFGLNLNPKIIFGTIGEKNPIKSLILLTKTNKENSQIIRHINKKQLIKRLEMINKLEFEYFSNLINVYSYIFPECKISSFWEIFEQNLVESLSKVSCHEVEIPLKYNNNTFKEILGLIQSGKEVK